jgi:hypothetical protein
MHVFDGHRFDWRWEQLETLATQLEARWDILVSSWDTEAISNDGELKAQGVERLARALKGDVPGCQLMVSATAAFCKAVGDNGRWMKGCYCHKDLHEQCSSAGTSAKKKAKLMTEALDGADYCCWMGCRLTAMAHGADEQLIHRVQTAQSEELNKLVAKAPPAMRSMATDFLAQVTSRYCEIVAYKWRFTKQLPHIVAGLFGMYQGYSLEACGAIAAKMFFLWESVDDKRGIGRVAVKLMTNEVLLRQLQIMRESPRPLHTLPSLFVFTLRIAAQTMVGHWLEGRHRQEYP